MISSRAIKPQSPTYLIVGSRMVVAAEGWRRVRSVAEVHLIVRESNAGVDGFYERLGFEIMPRIAMAKWL